MPGQHRSGHDLTAGAPATFAGHVRPDGAVVRWESRRPRKHQKPSSSRVTLTDHGRTATGTLFFDPEGRLTDYVAQRCRTPDASRA